MIRTRLVLSFGLPIVGIFACGGEAPPTDADLGHVTQPSVISAWARGAGHPYMAYCWQAPSPADAGLRVMLSAVAIAEYFQKSAVVLLDWGDCGTSGSTNISVEITGNGDSRLVDGTRPFHRSSTDSLGGYILLNRDRPGPGTDFLHELGHALGIQHEQNRPDSPCRNQPSAADWGKEAAVGPYDPFSIMNYCLPGAIDPGKRLSPGDSFALKDIYGSAGYFANESDGTYRYRLGQKCRVVNANQAAAFNSHIAGNYGGEPTNVVSGGTCIWPDGFYKAYNSSKLFYLFANEGPAALPLYGSSPVLSTTRQGCWIENASQSAYFYATGREYQTDVTVDELFRGRVGGPNNRCNWPPGVYRMSGTAYGVELSDMGVGAWEYCRMNSLQLAAAGGDSVVRDVTPDSTVLSIRTNKGDCKATFIGSNNTTTDHTTFEALVPSAKFALAMDFDSSFNDELVLVGGPWNYFPYATNNGNGTFTFKKRYAPSVLPTGGNPPSALNSSAAGAGAQVVAGDFNGDSVDEILLLQPGWGSAWLAKTDDFVTSYVVAIPTHEIGQMLSRPGAKLLAGDIDGDGYDDLAVVTKDRMGFLPVLHFSAGGSAMKYYRTWPGSPYTVDDFNQWAASPGAKIVSGDFNGDGRAEIALTGVAGWASIPIAFFQSDQTARIANLPAGDFAIWAATPGVQIAVGNFDNHPGDDLALWGGPGWQSIPVAYSRDGLSWSIENATVAGEPFPVFQAAGVQLVGGYFNYKPSYTNWNVQSQLALVGGPAWRSIPIASRYR